MSVEQVCCENGFHYYYYAWSTQNLEVHNSNTPSRITLMYVKENGRKRLTLGVPYIKKPTYIRNHLLGQGLHLV